MDQLCEVEVVVVDHVRPLAHVSQRSRESHGEMAIELVFAAECDRATSLRRCSRRMRIGGSDDMRAGGMRVSDRLKRWCEAWSASYLAMSCG